jgi:hypothetical protein
MSRSSSLPRGLVDAVVAPGASFAALRDARGWGWAALALILITQTVAIIAFFAPMSPEWLVEEQMLRMGDVAPTDEAAIRSTLESMAGNYAAIAAAGAAVTIALMMPLLGLVYFLANRVTSGTRYSFVAWTRFATWTQLPLVIASLGLIALTLVSSQPDLPLSAAQFASINALLLNLPADHAWFNWAEQLNMFTLWSAVLATIGVRTWVGLGWGVAAFIGALPWLLVFGIWALLV